MATQKDKDLHTALSTFGIAFKSYASAAASIATHFQTVAAIICPRGDKSSLAKKKELREKLIDAAMNSGSDASEKTIKNIVSRLMADHGLELRKRARGKRQPSSESIALRTLKYAVREGDLKDLEAVAALLVEMKAIVDGGDVEFEFSKAA